MKEVWRRWKLAMVLFLAGLAGCNGDSLNADSPSRNPGSVTGGSGRAIPQNNHDGGTASAAGRGVEGTTGSGTTTGR